MPAQETAFPNAIKPHSSVLCKVQVYDSANDNIPVGM